MRRCWGKQLLRCGTAVAANYRAACRSRSRAEWIAKIGLVVEEADEPICWLEMLSDCEIVKAIVYKTCCRRPTSYARFSPARQFLNYKITNYKITKLRDG
ncbi:MAG: hypothetical protein DMG68_05745 [Acidobacteria bacterium]|nr:MAG: hypothetical protein DMG68_05745 [Acidobacteriota bacterium]